MVCLLSEESQSEKDISYVFTHMCNLRNLTEDHGGREGEKELQKETHFKYKDTNMLKIKGQKKEDLPCNTILKKALMAIVILDKWQQ